MELNAAELIARYSNDTNTEKRDTGDSIIHLERIKPPRFSGDIRDYPRFKSDFQQLVAQEIKKTSTVVFSYISKLAKV